MWSLWLFPLTIALFVAGLGIAVVLHASRRASDKPARPIVWLLPLGLAATPLAGIAVLGIVTSFFQASDRAIFEEVFGFPTHLAEADMLSDDFGRGATRQIFLRIDPDARETARVMALPGLRSSTLTPQQFALLGAPYQFSWWLSTSAGNFNFCETIRVFEAPGFNGWDGFTIAHCVDGGSSSPGLYQTGNIYIAATRRS